MDDLKLTEHWAVDEDEIQKYEKWKGDDLKLTEDEDDIQIRRMKDYIGMILNSQNTEPLLSFPQHCSQQLQVCSFLPQSSELCGRLFRDVSMVGFVFFQYSILQFKLFFFGTYESFCAYLNVGNILKIPCSHKESIIW